MSYEQIIKQYKSYIASSYISLTPEQINILPKGKLHVSKKYDGLFCCLILNSKDNILLMPNGTQIPEDKKIIKELQKIECEDEIIIAGELYALNENSQRERSSDVRASLAQKNGQLYFAAFDIVQSSKGNLDNYPKKIEYISEILKGLEYSHVVETHDYEADSIPNAFQAMVIENHNEGLIIRDNQRIYKMKQNIDLDLIILAYTSQQHNSIRSIALGIALSDKEFLHVGSVGSLGSNKEREELYNHLSKLKCESSYRMSSSNGSLYQFVIPKTVINISAKDVQMERHDSSPVSHIALLLEDNKLKPLHLAPSFSIIHANANEIRLDKKISIEACGINQFERAGFFIKDIKTNPDEYISSMRPSEIIKKQVFTKKSKDDISIKKFMILKTRKKETDYPKYLFYYLDMSEKRKIQIQRDVRPFNNIKSAEIMMENYIEKNIKKGWEKYNL